MNERDRIEQLVARFATDALVVPSGDDAAVVRPRGELSVTSVDAVVDGVHFRSTSWPPHAVGSKAVGAALSDLAAMGAAPGELYIAAGLPTDFSDARFDSLLEGITSAAGGVQIAGGDLVASPTLWLSVTVVGYAAGADAIVTRDGAAAGDLVVVTGSLGAAARALELIEQGEPVDPALTAKQFSPQPRLAAGAALAKLGASAMIDISDGLARDAGHVAKASGVRLEIDLMKLPLAPGIDDHVIAATSGEEYELLATVAPNKLDAACAAELETELTVIGEVRPGTGAALLDASGDEVELGGFDHFD